MYDTKCIARYSGDINYLIALLGKSLKGRFIWFANWQKNLIFTWSLTTLKIKITTLTYAYEVSSHFKHENAATQ